MWILPDKQAALAFTPAELHFLFPAPITRRQLVQYKLLQAQVGILFGALVSAFFFGRAADAADGWGRVLAFWLFFAIAHLHGIAASFVRTDLIEAGWSAVRRRALSIAVALVIVGAVFVSARDAWTEIARRPRRGSDEDVDSTRETSAADRRARARGETRALERGPVAVPGAAAAPARAHAGRIPALRRDRARDAAAALRVGDALRHVVRGGLARALAEGRRAPRGAAGPAAPRRAPGQARARRSPWKLAPTGAPETALVWKNLVNLTRVTPVRALFALALFLLVMI